MSAQRKVIVDVVNERIRQEQLRLDGRFVHTCADPDMADGAKLACLTEELGEVARAMLHRDELTSDGGGDLRTELVQVAAVAVAWAEALTPGP